MKASFEKIIPPATNSFKVYAYEKPEFDAPWHYHPEYELTYIVSSHGVRFTGNHFENFSEDDLVLLGPNVPHCWKNTGTQTHKASAIVLHWDESLLGIGWRKNREFEKINRLLQWSDRGLKFNRQAALSVKERLERLLTVSSFEKLILLLEILHELSLTDEPHTLCKDGFKYHLEVADHERINIVHHFVRTKYAEKITLSDIANAVHMGRESFSRFFSKIMNKPFFSFLNEYRINTACKLLIESDMSVFEICFACGFESLPFFHRQFKRYKGKSPNRYRAAYKGLGSAGTTHALSVLTCLSQKEIL